MAPAPGSGPGAGRLVPSSLADVVRLVSTERGFDGERGPNRPLT